MTDRGHHRPPFVVVVALGVTALAASGLTVIGSDMLWLPAMGEQIRSTGSIPAGIPFAAASSASWVNTTALGQVVMSLSFTLGSIGVVATHVIAVTTSLSLLALEGHARGARPGGTALATIAVAVGAAAPLLIARAQLLSLVPFALLMVLLRRQHDRPSTSIWWAVPLLAFWSNLHGAVLVGVAALGCYLLFDRLRVSPLSAVLVGLASLAATCLNPGLLAAPQYYLGVFSGAATSDDSGMWSRLSLDNPFDILLMAISLALIVAALRRRQALWEYAAGLGLLIATLTAGRHGIWLLLFAFIPAATSVGDKATEGQGRHTGSFMALTAVFAVGCAAVLALRAPVFSSADAQARRVAEVTRHHAVLATEPLSESLAAAGARVWLSNPLDAFSQADQLAYLAFMNGDGVGARRALDAAEFVIAVPGSQQSRMAHDSGYVKVGDVGDDEILHRP